MCLRSVWPAGAKSKGIREGLARQSSPRSVSLSSAVSFCLLRHLVYILDDGNYVFAKTHVNKMARTVRFIQTKARRNRKQDNIEAEKRPTLAACPFRLAHARKIIHVHLFKKSERVGIPTDDS